MTRRVPLQAAWSTLLVVRPRVIALAAAACVATACDSGSPGPSNDQKDGSVEGVDGGPKPHRDAGTKDASHGGRPDTGPVEPTKDTTPPTFNGIKTIDPLGEGSVRVSWDPATDDVSAPSAIGYRVYRSSMKGGEDFSHRRRCGAFLADASTETQAKAPCYVTAAAGATSAVLVDALPGTDFFYVARAIDTAGNEDRNTSEVSIQTKDETVPIFGGVDSLTAVNATSVEVTWGTAFDTNAPDSQLTYDVFLKQDDVPNPDKDKPTYTSKPGEHSTIIGKLDPLTTYHVIVRATDPSGNTEGNTYSLGVTTPEGIAPTFTGLKKASAEGKTVRLFWLPASDNVTHPENIVYDVYSSFNQHKEDFNKPPRATSQPGAASIVIEEANLATRYFYVVRARDFAGNRDSNNIEGSATTAPLPDTQAPTFGGADTVTPAGPASLTVSWHVPSDDTSIKDFEFTYFVYVSSTTPVPTTTPSLVVHQALKGTVVGLASGATYNVVVTAADAAGNVSKPGVPTTGKTADAVAGDVTAPTLGNAVPVVAQVVSPPTSLTVSWPAATDTPNAAADIRYHVCASKVRADCAGSKFAGHVNATTDYGILTATTQYLDPRTNYFINVRAEDRAGNLESADHFTQATTATSWTLHAQPILFNHCVSCHDYNNASVIRGVLSSYAQESTEKPSCTTFPKDLTVCLLPLIDPGRPEFSLIYRRINPLGLTTAPFTTTKNLYSGPREPRDTIERLTPEEDSILLDWITQGALAN